MDFHFSPPLLTLLDEDIKSVLLQNGSRRHFTDARLVHSRGSAQAGLSLILSGAVRFGLYTEAGDYIETSILREGHCFGEATLFAGRPRAYDAEAIGDTVILEISKNRFEWLVVQYPTFAANLLQSLTARLYDALEFANDLRTLTAEARVARQLWRYLVAGQFDGDVIPIRQSDLAAVLGLSRVSVGKALDALQKSGVLSLGYRQIKILDREALAVAI